MNDQISLAGDSNDSVEPVNPRATLAPRVDVYENADELLLVADVPGASHDGIDVHLEKGQLTIFAKRSDDPGGAPVATEYRPCDYLRVFAAPHGIDASKIEAALSGGVLRLRLPKSDSVKPRRIEVTRG